MAKSEHDIINEMVERVAEEWLSSPVSTEERQRLFDFVAQLLDVFNITERKEISFSLHSIASRAKHAALSIVDKHSKNSERLVSKEWEQLENKARIILLEEELKVEQIAQKEADKGNERVADDLRFRNTG